MAAGALQTFGPWTALSRKQSETGSSECSPHLLARDTLHEKQVQPEEPAPAKNMAATRLKRSPDFVLASNRKGSQDNRHDPKAQRERMNLFKRQLAANRTRGTEEAMMRRNKALSVQRPVQESPNSFVTRSMVEALREERLADGVGGAGGGGGGGGRVEVREDPDDVETHHIAAEDWPFIYFVVALDQMPVASDDMGEYKVGKPPHTARERQRFLAARKRRIQQSREEMERIRESNIDMGLRLEPIRPPSRPSTMHHSPHAVAALRKRASYSKHPPTPISSGSTSREFPMHRGDYFLNHADELVMEDMMCRGFSQWFSDNFSMNSGSQPGGRPGGGEGGGGEGGGGGRRKREPDLSNQNKGIGSNIVELPDILPDQLKWRPHDHQPSSAPGSLNAADSSNGNSNKKVHFAEGLPFIKGSGIAALQKEAGPQPGDSGRPETMPPCTTKAASGPPGQSDMLPPPWSAPVTSRSQATMTPRSKMFKPMPIPKIDIVSEIYDELIVKTIQSFLEREGYSTERFSKLRDNIMARLSATYPHLARHRAWRLVRKDTGDSADAMAPITEMDERSRMRLRPLHQGFFGVHPDLEMTGDFAKEQDAIMSQLQHSARNSNEQLRPRWVPVLPTCRPPSTTREDDRFPSSMFMAVDGRHIVFTPRDDLRFKTATLPGATSDYRMAPLVIQDDKPVKTWTHIIPGAADE